MTKHAFIHMILFLFMGGTMVGCFGCFGSNDQASSSDAVEQGSGDSEGNEEAPESFAGAMEEAQQAMQEAQEAMQQAFNGEEGAIKRAVDFRALKDLLPEEVAGMDRVSSEGERSGAMGFNISRAEAQYEDGDERMTIEITDLGTLTGFARMGFAAWLAAEVDRESDRGFERTVKYRADGNVYPSFEKFESTDGDRGSCEFQVWVAERFIVKFDGRNVEVGQCEDAREEIDYGDLDDMKMEGVEAQ